MYTDILQIYNIPMKYQNSSPLNNAKAPVYPHILSSMYTL